MGVVVVGGNECMVRQYKELCREYKCKAKIYPKMAGTLKNIGLPDLLVLFTSTVSHTLTDEVRPPEGHVLRYTLEYKMIRSALRVRFRSAKTLHRPAYAAAGRCRGIPARDWVISWLPPEDVYGLIENRAEGYKRG